MELIIFIILIFIMFFLYKNRKTKKDGIEPLMGIMTNNDDDIVTFIEEREIKRSTKSREIEKEIIKEMISNLDENCNEFIALDVETANRNKASICQIGLVAFENGKIINKESILVDPEDYFDPGMINIHGIDEDDIEDEPTFKNIYSALKQFMENRIVAIYTAFDKNAFNAACQKYDLEPINCIWFDVSKVVRRTWDQYRNAGYKLSNVANDLRIEFEHHNAVEDAKAAGIVLLKAIEETGVSLYNMIKNIDRPLRFEYPVAKEGNPNGHLFGERIVFTGKLSMSRYKAANIAASAGCTVADNVTKKTTILVIGEQKRESTKYRKAKQWIEKGQSIRIINEDEFNELVNMVN